jgi:thiosulfate dehydrogenase (quinone) large subunit
MTNTQKLSLFLLRISLGGLFLYAGLTKVINPAWSSAGYLKGAKAFGGFYAWLASPGMIGLVDFMNEWGLTLLGISLILGIAVRLSAVLGMALMLLYYIPLGFPYPNTHAFIVDEHIVYIFGLAVLASFRAGRVWGLESWCANLSLCAKFPVLRRALG